MSGVIDVYDGGEINTYLNNQREVKSSKEDAVFSPNNSLSAEYAKALSAGIVALRLSGELQQILDGYEVKDWK